MANDPPIPSRRVDSQRGLLKAAGLNPDVVLTSKSDSDQLRFEGAQIEKAVPRTVFNTIPWQTLATDAIFPAKATGVVTPDHLSARFSNDPNGIKQVDITFPGGNPRVDVALDNGSKIAYTSDHEGRNMLKVIDEPKYAVDKKTGFAEAEGHHNFANAGNRAQLMVQEAAKVRAATTLKPGN